MKLKFIIEYGTLWGEALHVVLNYHGQDGATRSSNLPMTTQDGQMWTLETAVVESRQQRVGAISYWYQVENGEGQVLRREWTHVKRIYWFDPSRHYVFEDQWRDWPLCAHLYTNAYQTMRSPFQTSTRRGDLRRSDSPSTRGGRGEASVEGSQDGTSSPLLSEGLGEASVEARRWPLYRRTALFRVSAPQLTAGQAVALLGSHPMTGGWSEARYLRMEPIGQGDWMLAVNMDAVSLPLEYKYVVVSDDTHELLAWEEGDNRMVCGDVDDGEVSVFYGGLLRLRETLWRAAGVVVPVFALRSEHSFGVGDFGDLRRMVDWAVATGMRVIQLLPVNDTTTDGRWHDSYPYNITSCFALHPHYLDLEQLGELKNRSKMTVYRRQQRELNALAYSDYEAVERVKGDYVSDIFAERGQQLLASKEFKAWFDDNAWWLEPYAEWCKKRLTPHSSLITYHSSLITYIQYNLHLQLKAAADYARSKGVVLKGDLPIGVNRDSVETLSHPDLFNLDCQTGAPPDAFSPLGQNWGFPTYQWASHGSHPMPHASLGIIDWFRRRFRWMEQYFDAVRIDHVLGFFRIWEIPAGAVYGLLGHFSPALPLTVGEIEYFGLPFRRELFTRPFINDRILERFFGMHAQYVRDTFLVKKAYGLYDLKEDYDTQCKVVAGFEGRGDENSLWIRDGLLRLIANVLFVEDPRQSGMYHPRINAWQEPVFEALGSDEKDAYMRLYNNFFYQRHSMFWGDRAMHRLGDLLEETRLLVCAEDLGMLPDCVAPVLDALRILTLEVQTLPKMTGYEFSHLDSYPYRSVATFATHDMPPLRLWWEESPERTQRYYVTMLQKEGRAPEHLPAHLAEEIIARHLYCPSMLCLLSLQDWLAMDGELRRKNAREERINVPSDSYNRWQYRMHVTIEQLLKADRYNNKVRTMITRSKR